MVKVIVVILSCTACTNLLLIFIHLFLYLTLRALSVIIYLVFLFLVVIVLLNVLIAQVSDTYSKVLSTAEGVYLYRRCRYAINLDKQIDGAKSLIKSAVYRWGPGIILCCLPCACLLFLDYVIALPVQICVS